MGQNIFPAGILVHEIQRNRNCLGAGQLRRSRKDIFHRNVRRCRYIAPAGRSRPLLFIVFHAVDRDDLDIPRAGNRNALRFQNGLRLFLHFGQRTVAIGIAAALIHLPIGAEEIAGFAVIVDHIPQIPVLVPGLSQIVIDGVHRGRPNNGICGSRPTADIAGGIDIHHPDDFAARGCNRIVF